MRATLGRCAIVAAVIVTLSGCRSGASSSGWNWGRKSAGNGNSGAVSGPQLPSASATPAGAPANSYAGANPYQAAPYGGQPTSYNNTAGGYGATPANNYSAAPNAAAGAYAAQPGAVAPQNGPYNESYGQGAAGGYANTATPGAGQPGGYQATADPYANQAQPAGGGTGGPTENYRASAQPPANAYGSGGADPNAGGAYSTADNRSTDRYKAGAAQAEQSAADRYSAAGSANSGAASPPAASTDRYTPGNTGYNPGQTGYNPPGSTPYQSPTQVNVAGTARRDPYYRPGGTSDYVGNGSSQTPAASSADRYGTPAAGAGAAGNDPNAAPQGGQPAGGYQAQPSQGGY